MARMTTEQARRKKDAMDRANDKIRQAKSLLMAAHSDLYNAPGCATKANRLDAITGHIMCHTINIAITPMEIQR